MRAWLWALILVGVLVMALAVYVTFGVSWDQKITTYLTTLKSQTGWDIRSTPKSQFRFQGLHVQGLVVTGPRGLQGVLRDVTFSLNLQGWLRGEGFFDQIHLGSLEILRQGQVLYRQNDLTFSLKKTKDHRLMLSGQGMALRALMRPERTDFDGVVGDKWIFSGSWSPEGKVVFRGPPAGFSGLKGSLTLDPQRLLGDITLITNQQHQNNDNVSALMAALAGFSGNGMMPDTVDFTLRSDSIGGVKKVAARFYRTHATDPLGVDITGNHDVGPFAASLTVQTQQGWQITLNTLRLGGIEGSGSWSTQTQKAEGTSHDIRLRLRRLSLSPSSSLGMLSRLRGLQDQYRLFVVAEETQLGSVPLNALEADMTVKQKVLNIHTLRMKTSLEGRFSLSGTLAYPTNTPQMRLTVQTAGPFFTDMMAFLPNLPRIFSYLNGDLKVTAEGYAHYPNITLNHRDDGGGMASFQGRLEPFTAPPRFNGVMAYTLSPETKVQMGVIRGEKDLRLSKIQGTFGGFPFSGQGSANLTITPPLLQASLYAPKLSVQALSRIGQLSTTSPNTSSCPAGQALPLPTAAKTMTAQIRLRTDRLMTDYGDLTQVDQKISFSEQGLQTALTGQHGRGHLAARMHVMPGQQGLPILEMKLHAKDMAFSNWGGSTTVSLKTASWGPCLQDHVSTLTGQGTFRATGMRPPSNVLKNIQNLAGAALSRPLTPQDLDMRSVWLQGDFRDGTLTLQGAEVKLPAADITLQGALQMTSQRVNLRASVTSPQTTKPITITLNGPMARPEVQINNQSLWQYLLLGGRQ